jgi:hypothetical protein
MDLTDIPLVDHHAHPLSRGAATSKPPAFRRWFTESTDAEIHRRHVPHTLFFRSAVRWLAEALDCPPTLDEVLRARAAVPYERWTRRLFKQANIQLLLCDYGYSGEQVLSHEEMQSLLPCEVQPILRLETLAEELIVRHETLQTMVDDFLARVGRARRDGYRALKSIIAYRSGLNIALPSEELARRAFAETKAEAKGNERVRLASKPLCDYLVWHAAEIAAAQQLPLQLHTGFGDRDADLLGANPLHLRTLIESVRAPLVLLHAGWPYYRETAHLASLYPHVWLDLSLAIPFATIGIPTMVRDVLGMAPFSKVMFATDAFTMPEIYWLAARWGRWAIGEVLQEMVDRSLLDEDEAYEFARLLLGGNARALYELPQ